MAERLSRRDVEERIGVAEKSISGRVGALERVFKPRRSSVIERAVRLPSTRIVSMVVAGAVVGWVFVSIGRRLIRRRRTTDHWVEDIVDEVAREKARGEDDRTALRRALGRECGRGPAAGPEGSAGLVSFVLGYAVRTGVQTLVTSVVDRWSRNGSNPDAAGDS